MAEGPAGMVYFLYTPYA